MAAKALNLKAQITNLLNNHQFPHFSDKIVTIFGKCHILFEMAALEVTNGIGNG